MLGLVKASTLEAATTDIQALRELLEKAYQERDSTKSILGATQEKFREQGVTLKQFENDMQAARAAHTNCGTALKAATEAVRASAESVRLKDRAQHEDALQALQATLAKSQASLTAEIQVNHQLRADIATLREGLARVQNERDTLEAAQRHVRTDTELQIQATEKASAARIRLLENELAGYKGKV